jgi:hypothetical protein
VFDALRGGEGRGEGSGGGASALVVDGQDLSDDALMRAVDAGGGAACANPVLRLDGEGVTRASPPRVGCVPTRTCTARAARTAGGLCVPRACSV